MSDTPTLNGKTPRKKPGPKKGVRKTAAKQVEGVVVGRDKTIVPPGEVFKLAAMGCKDTEIADWFGIDSNTLRYNFSVELTKGRESMKQSLRQAMLTQALGGNATLLIWLSKNFLGMSDNPSDTSETQPLPWVVE